MKNVRHKKRIRLKGFAYKGPYRYFLTLRAAKDTRPFTDVNMMNNLVEILGELSTKTKFTVWSYCFMPDHLHLLVEGVSDDSDMRKFISLFKQKSAFDYKQATGKKLWQQNYYEHVLRSDEDTETIAKYILANPVRKGLVVEPKEYPFSGTLAAGLSLYP